MTHSRREPIYCTECDKPVPGYIQYRLGAVYCSAECREKGSIEEMRTRLAQLERPALDHRSLLVRRGLLQA